MGAMSKQNQRQNKKHEAAYARYRTTAQRELNKMRGLLRHLRDFGMLATFDGRAALGMKVEGGRDKDGAIAKAWSKCVERTGVGPAKNVLAEFGQTAI